MSRLSELQDELTAVRLALRGFASGEREVSVSIGGMSVTYDKSRMSYLERRERVLYARVNRGNNTKGYEYE
jgi:hypothetical protein